MKEFGDEKHLGALRLLGGFQVLQSEIVGTQITDVKVFTTTILSFSPQGRIGGLSVLQTEAEVAASSVEKVVPDRKKAEATNVVSGKVSDSKNRGVFNAPGYLEKDFSVTKEIDSPEALFEATRGKVDALKQVGCTW